MVGQVRPGMLSSRLEQARKAADLRVHVLLAALDDQARVRLGGDDLLGPVGRGAEHAHGMIVA